MCSIVAYVLLVSLFVCLVLITDDLVWFFQGLFLIPKMIPVCFGIEVIVTLCVINKRFGKVKFPFIPFMAVGLIAAFLIQLIFM